MRYALAIAAMGFQGEPASLAVSPAYGVDTGGTSVTITGSGFVTGATVTFGGVAATSVVVVSPTQITCAAPAGTGGNAVDVVVTDPDGESATLSSGFTYYSLPSVLGSHLTAWWADTMTVSGNDITQWTDLSGNSRHLTPAAQIAARTITGCASAGGLIQVTTSVNHGFSTNDPVTVANVLGTTEANGNWTITVTGLKTFTLNGSTFVHAYTSGGTATDTNLHRPTKSAAALNGHDVATFTPGSGASAPNGPQYLQSGSTQLASLITAATYYSYWLVKIDAINSNFSPFSGTNESIWAENTPDFAAGLSLKQANNLLSWNFGGNVDPTNGETASTTFTLAGWVVVTQRHLAGKIGVRVGSGAWVETTSSNTLFGTSNVLVGVNFSSQIGITGKIAVGFFANAAPTAQQDLALLAYLRAYGAL